MTNPRRLRSIEVVLVLTAVVSAHASWATAADVEAPPHVRVRSNHPSMAAVIDAAAERSAVFRRLITTIDASDGLVYVDAGACGHAVAACLSLSIQIAGPFRLLRILVDTRKHDNDCDLMAAIGHELRHAIEVLSEPKVRDYHAAFSFFEREGPTDRSNGRFETPAAVRIGLEVLAQVCPR